MRHGPGTFLLWCLVVGTPGAYANAGEVYSWIDQSGAIAMTDDPGKIPPATQRRSLSIHRFETEAPGVAPAVEAGASEPSPRPAPQEGRRDAVESRPAQAAAGEAADSDVVLKMTEDVDHESYVWMPFQTPMVLGSEIIDGFWWHPGVTSPVDAFKSYLRRHHYPVPRGSWGSSLLRPGRARRTEETSSGNSVYDQVVRERQLLIQRNGLLFGTPPVSPPKVQQAEPGLRAPR